MSIYMFYILILFILMDHTYSLFWCLLTTKNMLDARTSFTSLSFVLLLFRPSGYLPNGIHAVEAMLAAASIGAIWSSTSVDFGVNVSN